MFFRALRPLWPTLKLRAIPQSQQACLSLSAQRTIISNIGTTNLQNKIIALHIYTPQRCKKTSSKRDGDSDEEDDWDSLDRSLTRDSKVVKFRAPSMRMDLILKSSLGIARNKIEKVFYDSKIRLNGKKVTKKSAQVHVGDEIDLVKGFSPKNPDHILVSRIEILDVTASKGDEAEEPSITISARRFKTLLVENYDKEPYKESTADSEQ